MKNDNTHLMLFACCIPVKGARRSLICDLQKESFEFIPNVLYQILNEFNGKTLKEIFLFAGEENKKSVNEYLDLLISKHYCFLTDEPENFPLLDLTWDSPSVITNSIIDFEPKSNHDMEVIVKELNSVGCSAVQLRFYYSPSLAYLKKVISSFDTSRVRSIDLVCKYSPSLNIDNVNALARIFPRLCSVIITSSSVEKFYQNVFGVISTEITYTKQVVDSPKCCGTISHKNFRINIPMFTEATKHNTCLNRKLSIDAKGQVKNCPTADKSYGKLGESSFLEVASQSHFQTHWNINKDQIDVCKHCEFRYICTDCRVLLKQPDNIYSKPLKCDYNPYEAKWSNE